MTSFTHVLLYCLTESNSLQVSFTLNEELTVIEGLEKKTVSAPREHNFTMQSVGGQTLTVFTENSSGNFLFSSARCHLWTPLQQYTCFLLWACSLVNYLFVPEPKGNFCGSGGGSSSHSAFFLYSSLSSFAHLLVCSVCYESVHIFT